MLSTSHSLIKGALEWLGILAVALIAAFLIREFVVSPYTVPTSSMEPTILVGDNILAEKISLLAGSEVEQGDIIVFTNPDGTSDHDILVKRVIATSGQTVELIDGSVYIDGELYSEDYVQGQTYPLSAQAAGSQVSFPYTVPEDSVWVMGDNRENSADSRYFGEVSTNNIIGVVVFRYWPLSRIGLL